MSFTLGQIRKCSKCSIDKTIDQFYCGNLKKDGTRGIRFICIACSKQCMRQYALTNKRKIASYQSSYRLENRAHRTLINKQWRHKNIIKFNHYMSSYVRSKEKTDLSFKLKRSLRRRLNNALHNNQKKGSAVQDLGCSIAKLKIYLQLRFHRNPRGKHEYMTWDNWSRMGWHIDHIKPLSCFDLTDPKQLKEACHYTNLQPMWSEDNIKKSDRI